MDYYRILGIPRTSALPEIKQAYHKLALKFHPDHNPGNRGIERQFQIIRNAYDVLYDAEQRKFYDRFGMPQDKLMKVARPTPGTRFEGIVEQVVDEVLGGRKRKPKSGKDHRYRLSVSLEESLLGANKEIRFSREANCVDCNGLGAPTGADTETCHVCNQLGETRISDKLFLRFKRVCHFCEGRGYVVLRACSTCGGEGLCMKEEGYDIPIPEHCKDGTRLRIRGGGAPGIYGGKAGDLYVVVEVEEHPFFTVEHTDVHGRLPLTVREAFMGVKIQVPSLEGVLWLTVPAKSQSGDVLRVRGRGAPGRGKPGRGDLLFHVEVETPKLSPEQLEVLTRGWEDIPEDAHPRRKRFEREMKSRALSKGEE